MPIRPENKARYPKNWQLVRAVIRLRSGNRCEGSPAYPDCRAANGQPHPVTESKVVLTVAHLDHMPENCDGLENAKVMIVEMRLEKSNLRHWCQRCHLKYDEKHHAMTAAANRKEGKAIGDLFAKHGHILMEAVGGLVFITSFLLLAVFLPLMVIA